MKLAIALPLVLETALCASGTVGIDIYRARRDPSSWNTPRNAATLEKFKEAVANGDEVPESLTNGFYAYFANITIGSDDQAVHPMIDTGSSDLWVTSITNPYCIQDPNGYKDSPEQWDCSGYIFDPSTSTTYRNLTEKYHITYGDTTGAYGWLSQDTVKMSDATLPNATFAFATNSNSSDSVFGVGYKANEATTRIFKENGTVTGEYTNIPFLLKEDGFINSVAYSLYLNDAQAQTGQILFGGVDHAKYSGTLGLMPLIESLYPIYNHTLDFTVRFSGISVRTGDNVCPLADFVLPALLDSGTSYAVLPAEIVDPMGEAMGYTWPSTSNASFWQGSCSQSSFDFDSFELDFLGLKLQVPPQSLLDYLQDADGEYVLDNNGDRVCILAIQKTGSISSNILGDVFQRNWYVVYDIDNNQVAIAQSKLNETTDSDVEAIISTIPGASSVPSYGYKGWQTNVAVHSVTGACAAKATSKPVSSAALSSSARASSSGGSSAVRGASAVVSAGASASAGPSSAFSAPAASPSSHLASSSVAGVASLSTAVNSANVTAAAPSSSPEAVRDVSSEAVYVTTVVSQFVTTCPTPTTFATNGKTYTVTESTVLTITDCPCTLTHKDTATPSAYSTPVTAAPSEAAVSTTATSTIVTCPTPTTLTLHGKTYTVTESTVLTITDCSCTETGTPSAVAASSQTASSAVATPNEAAATSAVTNPGTTASNSETGPAKAALSSEAVPTSSAAAVSPEGSPSEAALPPAGTTGTSSNVTGPASVPAPSSAGLPSLAPESSAPVLSNSASRLSAALSAIAGAVLLALI